MNWQSAGLGLIITVALAGCSGPKNDCPDSCGRNDSIANKNECYCKCTDAQKHNPEHMCCSEDPVCKEMSAVPASTAGQTPGSVPVVSVQELGFFSQVDGDVNIDACEKFVVHFSYVNQMGGMLLTQDKYSAVPNIPPELDIVDVLGLTPPQSTQVPWKELAPGAVDQHDEKFDGIDPKTDNNSHSGTFAVSVVLPIRVSGVTTSSMNIGFFGSQCH